MRCSLYAMGLAGVVACGASETPPPATGRPTEAAAPTGARRQPEPEPPRNQPPAAPESAGGVVRRACIVVADEPAAVAAEGTLRDDDGKTILRLDAPRCVSGIGHTASIVEVMLVSESFDLRPLVGRRIRASGVALGERSPEGPQVIVVVRNVDRLPPKDDRP